jgi:uncharacterized repeat protein (TIGR03803 family)
LTALHRFANDAEGANPMGGLIGDAAGNLYGTTWDGGAYAAGAVFLLNRIGTETVLYSFSILDGCNPVAGVIRDSQGNLYGTTENCGTAFKLDSSGTMTILHQFTQEDGVYGGLIRDATGNLYGTTVGGGDPSCNKFLPGCGVIYKIAP